VDAGRKPERSTRQDGAPGVDHQARSEQLDAELLDAVSELIGRIITLGEGMAQRLCVPGPFIKVLHSLQSPMAMKELGKRMHCDPSFVTVLADMLEKRGLARREAHPGDRRVKNLVLTEAGQALKQRVECELAARMPWRRALSQDEREQLLRLIRKMLAAQDLTDAAEPGFPAGPAAAGPRPPVDTGEVADTRQSAQAPAS
jgi:MarR family transcriptional regulator, organic hydroperoxide resistance regulator